MDIFNSNLYPEQSKFKYPKAGEENSIVEIFVTDFKQKTHEDVNLFNIPLKK